MLPGDERVPQKKAKELEIENLPSTNWGSWSSLTRLVRTTIDGFYPTVPNEVDKNFIGYVTPTFGLHLQPQVWDPAEIETTDLIKSPF